LGKKINEKLKASNSIHHFYWVCNEVLSFYSLFYSLLINHLTEYFLPAFRVPRGLGYAPLWALLGLRVADPPPGIAGSAPAPHSQEIDQGRTKGIVLLFKLLPRPKGARFVVRFIKEIRVYKLASWFDESDV